MRDGILLVYFSRSQYSTGVVHNLEMIFFLRVDHRGVHRASNFVFAYSFEFEIENGQYFNSTRSSTKTSRIDDCMIL